MLDDACHTSFSSAAALQALFAVLLLAIPALPAWAQQDEPAALAATASVDLLSDYVFRGINYYKGVSIQPSVAGSYQLDGVGEFSAACWAQLAGEGHSARKSFYEIDYTAAYSVQGGPFTLTTGHRWYTFHQTELQPELQSTREIFGGFVFDALLTPSFMVNYDYEERSGQYYELSFSERLESASFGEDVGITPYVALGMAHRSSQYSEGGVVQVTYGVLTDIPYGPLVISPGLSITLSRDARTRDDVWFGVRARWQWY